MLTRSIHAPSLLIGILGAAVVLLSMSQVSSYDAPPRVEYGPHPRDMVQIKEGTPYVVPAGKQLVLTGLGTTSTGSTLVTLLVGGEPELRSYSWFGQVGAQVSVGAVPTGFTVQAGTTVQAADGQPGLDARAWGYLAKQ